MGSRSIGVCRPQAGRTVVPDPQPELPSCLPDAAARVLGAVLRQGVTAPDVITRAVGLGLSRHPAAGGPVELTPLALSRLFLAGYRLPAQVEAGTVPGLRQHLLAGRTVFALLDRPTADPGGPELVRVTGAADELGFLVETLGDATGTARLIPPELFARAWAAAGHFSVVAVRRWTDLPAEGRTFFGGTRNRDGTYHWDTAECATDGEGRVLRF